MGCSQGKSAAIQNGSTSNKPAANGQKQNGHQATTETDQNGNKPQEETMASLSDFQKKKLGYIYHVFYDVNNDGKVDWQDFSCALEKIAALNKWDNENPKKKQALECLTLVWDGLKKYADENSDEEISKEEWFKMWSDCADKVVGNQEFPYWLSSYMSFMFDAADTSGDAVIDKDEFRLAYTSFGLKPEVCDQAFDKFSDNSKIELTKEVYSKLWHEFFLSNDPTAKGNFLFGTIA